MRIATAVAAILLAATPAKAAKADDPLAKISCLVGEWAGVGEGQPGLSASERRTTRAHGRFIVVEGRSVYPKQERNKKGETHSSTDIWSYDRARGVLMMRQFDNLGFVSTYVEDKRKGARPSQWFMMAESLENVPKGWNARYAYECVSNDEYREIFELDAGKGFELYVSGRFLRMENAAR